MSRKGILSKIYYGVKRMKAIWDSDYDSRTDSIYKRPCCPKCREPIGLDGSDKYRCYSCGEVVEVTSPWMLKWFEDRSEIKYEYRDCPRLWCGGKGTMIVMYVRNNATLEWQTAQGKCKKCGMSFIV
jgi:hypothetical protein